MQNIRKIFKFTLALQNFLFINLFICDANFSRQFHVNFHVIVIKSKRQRGENLIYFLMKKNFKKIQLNSSLEIMLKMLKKIPKNYFKHISKNSKKYSPIKWGKIVLQKNPLNFNQ